MKCLSCSQEMVNYLVQTKKQQISYDICEACGSLWLDKGELDKTAFQVTGSIEYCSDKKVDVPAGPTKTCPRCDRQNLDKVRFIGCGDVALDRCPNCGGFWLDSGELDLVNQELKDIMPVQGKGFSDFVNNVHIPYWHKRIKRQSSQTDFQIETPPIKGASLVSQTEYNCPACESKLNQYDIFSINIDGCPKCRGVFLDKNELRKLKDALHKGEWTTLRWLDDELDAIDQANITVSDRLCPKCTGQKILTTSFGDSKILIDYCPKCHGIWLDGAEYRQIVDHLTAHLNKYSSKDMAAKAYQEIKEIWSGPENVVPEVLDAKAAIAALLNITIFEHPALFQTLQKISGAGRGIGLG